MKSTPRCDLTATRACWSPAAKNYNASLCRQPFNTDLYEKISYNTDEVVNICFNSRYSSTKGPHVILPFFDKYIKKGYNFKLNFRGNISDPVSIWHNIKHYFQVPDSEISMKDYATNIADIYDKQDYCIYAGYLTKEERGKIEYAILEPLWYGIPLIAHSDVFEYFKYEEYGITKEQLAKSFILLNDENLSSIINGTFDPSSYINEAKKIVDDFLPNKILERFDICINSPASKGLKKTELF